MTALWIMITICAGLVLALITGDWLLGWHEQHTINQQDHDYEPPWWRDT